MLNLVDITSGSLRPESADKGGGVRPQRADMAAGRFKVFWCAMHLSKHTYGTDGTDGTENQAVLQS